jgi:hypothetical protein
VAWAACSRGVGQSWLQVVLWIQHSNRTVASLAARYCDRRGCCVSVWLRVITNGDLNCEGGMRDLHPKPVLMGADN